MQGKMVDYGVEEQVADYLFLVIALGYVLLFCVVAPGVAAIGLGVMALQLRCAAWKLCSVFRRPFPKMVDGIGAWNEIIDVLSWLGVSSSVAIPLVHLRSLDQYKFSFWSRLLI